jgi:hypothetical protein
VMKRDTRHRIMVMTAHPARQSDHRCAVLASARKVFGRDADPISLLGDNLHPCIRKVISLACFGSPYKQFRGIGPGGSCSAVERFAPDILWPSYRTASIGDGCHVSRESLS